MSAVRVLVADDEPLVRAGLRVVLGSDPGVEVVAEAADGDEAVAAARRHRPDVALVDVRMPRADGIEATRRIVADPALPTRVLVLTTFGHDEALRAALAAGAHGFVLKRSRPAEVLDAVRLVARGGGLVVPESARALLAATPEAAAGGDPRLARLTAREREVLALLGEGRSNAEVAAALFLGRETVKSHVSAILAKTGARDRTALALLARGSGPAGRRPAGAADPPGPRPE